MPKLEFPPHPVLTAPTPEQIVKLSQTDEGAKALIKWHEEYNSKIRAAAEDPLRHGFELDSWKRIREMLVDYNEVLILGGNRGAKTTGGSKIVMESVTECMDGHIVMFSQNEDTSIKVQQASVWEFMPKEFKKKTKGIEGYINYSMQNGFTGKSFIFPDTRTRVDFKTYTQFSNNHTILEGFEFGFPGMSGDPRNIGIVNDEYLGDAKLINTQRFRLATRDGKMMTLFTPIDGYTELVAQYLKGAQTLATRPAALLDGEEVPVKQYSPDRDAGICYIHTDENPFGGYERIAKDLKKSSREEILVRAYGVPVKSMTSLFPLFSKEVHVFSELPKIDKKKWTVYQVVDPAGARNYVSIWAAINGKGDIRILKEWPDRDAYGAWAEFGEPKWKFGPASKKLGYDVQGYVDLFKEIEKEMGVEVFERIGDSRYFASENDDNVDLFTQFGEKGMHFVPADGRHEDIGLTALDEWFRYNPNAEVDEANKPILQIHESCGNLIYSILNYGSNGKKDEPLKDFIDLIRYLRMANSGNGPEHYDESAFKQERTTGGY